MSVVWRGYMIKRVCDLKLPFLHFMVFILNKQIRYNVLVSEI